MSHFVMTWPQGSGAGTRAWSARARAGVIHLVVVAVMLMVVALEGIGSIFGSMIQKNSNQCLQSPTRSGLEHASTPLGRAVLGLMCQTITKAQYLRAKRQ